MQRILMAGLAMLIALPALADTLHLKNGGRLEGKLLSEKDGKVEFMLSTGKAVFPASEVLKVVSGKTRLDTFAERKRALSFTDADGHVALAQWAMVEGLAKQADAVLAHVIALKPNHTRARRLMGHVLYKDKWVPKAEAQAAKGLMRYGDQWVTQAAYKRLTAETDEKTRVERVRRMVLRLAKKIAQPQSKLRMDAREELLALAKAESSPELAQVAGKLYKHWNNYYANRGHVTLEVRAQHNRVQQPIRTLNLNLGGTSSIPVAIQLPTSTHIQVNTTTIVPGN